MKKIAIVAVTLILVIVAGIFVIRVQEVDTDVTKNKTKVGMIMNGEKQDHSWGQSHYEAMEKISEELNLEIRYCENVPEDERCEAVMQELADSGCQIIIADSFNYGEWELKVAERYPRVYFYHATGVEERDNLLTYFGRIYQIRYLCGIIAGMQTETSEIGYVAAYPIPEVNRGINAFTLGVRSVNPDASVYVEWSNTWAEDEATENATRKLLNAHDIDVLAMHTNSLKVLEVAEEEGIWSIGYNMDNSELFPDTWLTAAVWNWEKFYEPRILECLQGKFQGRHYWEGIESGVVSYSPLSRHVKPGIAQVVEEKKKEFESGTFDVFCGPIKDQKGNMRIGEGESMTDEALLEEFEWYVEGVKFDE